MLARFVPIVRTFVPTVAGVSNMLWGTGITTPGFFLGEFDVVKDNIEIAAVAIVGISLLPIAFELLKHRREAHRTAR